MTDETFHSIDETLVQQFEQAWLEGRQPDLQGFLPPDTDTRFLATLQELVCIDLEFSFKNISTPEESSERIESYIARFPQLADPKTFQRLIREEAQLRIRQGLDASFAHYEKRFPGVINESDLNVTTNQPRKLMKAVSLGDSIGPYLLKRKLGEGGFGVVFLAEQSAPVKRKVALKVIKPGMGSETVIARFEAERQALALMDHESIARVLDAGTTDDGLPFFVMELVDGVAITDYCDQNRLAPRQRLELFTDVCNAIQHAHQKGVIHRDIKPSNIMVTTRESRPHPKVIDFGIAKALDQTMTEQSMFTQFGQIIGTPQYMSPEQAEMNSRDIDTRSDVYSLGVLLYEMLTGSTPITSEDFKQAAFDEMLRMVREQPHPKPSTRISQCGEAITGISESRQVAPSKLSTIVRGDLDWIVMKALEKDRGRRYETASAFADDIQRYLNHDAIVARPPSAAYHLNKFVQKNRGLVASLTVIAGLLIAGIAGTSWFAWRASNEAGLARAAETQAEQNANQANVAAKRASDVLTIVSESFQTVDPEFGSNVDMLAKDVLLNAKSIMEQSELDDLGKAKLLETLTFCFRGIGEYSAAVNTATEQVAVEERISSSDSYESLVAKHTLANALKNSGQTDKAIQLFEAVLPAIEAEKGPNHETTLVAKANLARCYRDVDRMDEAFAMSEDVVSKMKINFGIDHPETLSAISNQATAFQIAGQNQKALLLYKLVHDKRVATLSPENPRVLLAKNDLALAMQIAGETNQAVSLFEDAIEGFNKTLGETHPHTLVAMSNLADALRTKGKLAESISLQRTALKGLEKEFGVNNERAEIAFAKLARAQIDAGLFAEALPDVKKLYEHQLEQLGADHFETLRSLNDLAVCYQSTGQSQPAVEMLEKLLDAYVKKYGDENVNTIHTLSNLAFVYATLDRQDEALTMMERVVTTRRSLLGDDHPETLLGINNLASTYQRLGRLDDALPLFEECLAGFQKKLGPDHQNTLTAQNNLGKFFRATGEMEKAVELISEAYTRLNQTFGEDYPQTMIAKSALAETYLMMKRDAQAIEMYQQVLASRVKKLGADHPDTLGSFLQLADAYRITDQNEKSIPIIREALEGFNTRYGEQHDYTLSVAGKLVNALLDEGEIDAALPHYELIKTARGPDDSHSTQLMLHLGQAHIEAKQFGAAEPVLRECVTILEKISPQDSETFRAITALGEALEGSGEFEEATSLLEKAHTNLLAAESIKEADRIHLQKQMVARLLMIAKTVKNEDDTKRWQLELQRLLESKSRLGD